MTELNLDINQLMDALMNAVRQYGIREVSLEQYQAVCSRIRKFAKKYGYDFYTPELMTHFSVYLDSIVENGEICQEYCRFHRRVVRMLTSLAETGEVDFSAAPYSLRKYPVSDESLLLVEEILDANNISGKNRYDLRTPVRHIIWFAEMHGFTPYQMDDNLIMQYIIDEIPATNSGSTGRTLRCVKYVTKYLKEHGNTSIVRDYSMLTLRNAHIRMIPAFSENEIRGLAESVDVTTAIGKRDLAIMLLGYCTGLRGADIVRIRLEDIDWRNQRLSVIQSKNHQPIICELNGETMNALADYILEERPECDAPEVFVTVKGPVRKLKGGLTSLIDRYSDIAGIESIPMRKFHSLRRSFETVIVSNGVDIEIASQMMGHKTIDEDKPYITYDRKKSSLVSMSFADVPITSGIYSTLLSWNDKKEVDQDDFQ